MKNECKLRLLKEQFDSVCVRLNHGEEFVTATLGSCTSNDVVDSSCYFIHGDLCNYNVSGAFEALDTSKNNIVFINSMNYENVRTGELAKSYIEKSDLSKVIILVGVSNCDTIDRVEVLVGKKWLKMTSVALIGDDITYPVLDNFSCDMTESHLKTAQVFGDMTTSLLSNLTFGIVGVSGTGSIVAEQLYRLQVAKLVLIDDDIVEERNLGRIINASKDASDKGMNKAVMMKESFDSYGLDVEVVALPMTVSDDEAIHHLSQCDVVVGCMDSIDGRHYLNLISSYYVLPYFDIGVKLKADGNGSVDEVTTAVQYVIPHRSSLLSRGVYNGESLRASELLRSDPEAYEKRLEEKYIEGGNVNNPAVIPVNMVAASMGVMEILARLHLFREEDNSSYETIYVDLMTPRIDSNSPTERCKSFAKFTGKGDVKPLLGLVN